MIFKYYNNKYNNKNYKISKIQNNHKYNYKNYRINKNQIKIDINKKNSNFKLIKLMNGLLINQLRIMIMIFKYYNYKNNYKNYSNDKN